jgi:transposase
MTADRRQSKARRKKRVRPVPVINAHAGGIDVGATEIFVAVPPGRAAEGQDVRQFSTFTEDLHAMADWLQSCGVTTVAMESTSVYWMPLFFVLEQRGIEVCLVNARHFRNVPGRKTDVLDCEWLQYLHSVGLLRGSFHPPEAVAAVRTLMRHRGSLVQMASSHVQHMQKALTQMNLQLHHVISDITGVSGLAILDAIVAGERRPDVLAGLCHHRIKASRETVAKSLTGTWRAEHIFTLRQSLVSYRSYQQQIQECDAEMYRMLAGFESRVDPAEHPLPPSRKGLSSGFDLRTELYRIIGVDLTAVPGIDVNTIYTLFGECGSDFSAFPHVGHFASWLGLAPNNRITGGKVISTRTRKVKQRSATALRIAAQTLFRSQSALGDYARRMRYRLGPAKAVTAVAHKLARIIYVLVTTRQPYDESIFAEYERDHLERAARRLRRQAEAMGFQLVAASAT